MAKLENAIRSGGENKERYCTWHCSPLLFGFASEINALIARDFAVATATAFLRRVRPQYDIHWRLQQTFPDDAQMRGSCFRIISVVNRTVAAVLDNYNCGDMEWFCLLAGT
jgi:hypothetical protein